MILFLVHAIAGGFQLMGLLPGGIPLLSAAAAVLVVLLTVHTILGVILTAGSLGAIKKAGVSYFKENKLFWARRISGFAVFVFMLAHVMLFLGSNDGVYRLRYFGPVQLAGHILLVLAAAVHVITNVNPLLISFGIKGLKEYVADILIVLSFLLLFMGAAFVLYYIRWRA